MKKLILASAVAALSVSAAQAAPTVYGKAGVQLNYMEDGDVTLDSDSTRFGLKGGEAITGNTDLIYKLEFGLEIDEPRGDGSDAEFKQRDTYVGLANDQYGTLIGGRLTAIDDEINYTNPSEYADSFGYLSWDGDRVNNSIAYFTPSYDGLQLMAMYKLTDSDNGKEDEDNDADGSYGLGAKYEGARGAAGITYIGGEDGAGFEDNLRVSGAYDLTSDFTISGLYQNIDFGDDADEDEQFYTVAGEYDIPNSKWDIYGEYDATRDYDGVEGADVDVFSVGGNYSFTSATTGKVFLGYTDKTFDDSDSDNIDYSEDSDYFGGGVGILHVF